MSKNSTDNLRDLFQSQGKSLGLTEQSSSIIIANLDTTTTPMTFGSPFDDDEQECDDFRLVNFVLDSSISMKPVQGDVRDGMNKIIIPGLLEGAAPQVGAIRYSGLTFGSYVQELWPGSWRKLAKDPPKITAKEYSASGSTALHQGVLDGVTSLTAQALQIENQTGTHPECVLAVLSDGANNCAPHDPAPIKAILDSLSSELFTLVFIGFETGERVDFKKIAANLGFRDVRDLKRKAGETEEDLRREIRHVFKVFSEKLVGRVSTSQVGSSVSQTGSSGFWD